jgi:hypothetical protein
VAGDLDDTAVLVEPHRDHHPARQGHEKPDEGHRHREEKDDHDDPTCID